MRPAMTFCITFPVLQKRRRSHTFRPRGAPSGRTLLPDTRTPLQPLLRGPQGLPLPRVQP